MTIAEFARKRGVEQQAVYKYVQRHPDLFEGHLSDSQPRQLDDTALRILSEQYPMTTNVTVMEDTDIYKQLVAAQDTNLKLLEQIRTYEKIRADAEASQRLLEQRDHDNEWLKGQIDKLQGEISQIKQEAAEAEKKAEDARKENERLKTRGFWARIFNR